MKPMFFGDSRRPLFGVYHPASPGGAGRRAAVLLCYPGIHEYNVSHWAFRRLAGTLSRAGLDVMRFDYFGTGDSAGETAEGSPEKWITNIQAAARELRDLAGARPLCLVGLRLGAALAVRACAEGLAVRDLVLWDPVVRGDEYLSELVAWNEYRNLLLLHARRSRREADELLGFRLNGTVRSQIEATDVCQLPKPAAERVLVLTSEQRASYARLCRWLAGFGLKVDVQSAPETRTMAQSVIGEEAFAGSEALGIIARELTTIGKEAP